MNPSSVGATINLLLASATARGASRIENAAREPDVVVFGQMLQKMGAHIRGLGTDTIDIEGVHTLSPVDFHNAPDRIELGTFMIAAAIAGKPGEPVRMTNAAPEYLGDAFVDAFTQTGAGYEPGDNYVDVTAPDKLLPVSIETGVYPGFPLIYRPNGPSCWPRRPAMRVFVTQCITTGSSISPSCIGWEQTPSSCRTRCLLREEMACREQR